MKAISNITNLVVQLNWHPDFLAEYLTIKVSNSTSNQIYIINTNLLPVIIGKSKYAEWQINKQIDTIEISSYY
jgi:hypothetical protein